MAAANPQEPEPRPKEGTFAGRGGLELFYRAWLPRGTPRSAVVLVHGVNEHTGRYANVVGPLVAKGHAVYGMDLRGFGLSKGTRAHIDRWADYREDLAELLRLVRSQQSGRPLFLYGHSMGAMIVLDYAIREPSGLRGVIASGTPIEPSGVAKAYLVAIARILSNALPKLSMRLPVESRDLSRDPAVARAYDEDPLVTRKVTVRWATESLDVLEFIKADAQRLPMPVLILHGEVDRMAALSGARWLLGAIPGADKELKVYAGGYHEPHNDLEHERVLADVASWLDAHL